MIRFLRRSFCISVRRDEENEYIQVDLQDSERTGSINEESKSYKSLDLSKVTQCKNEENKGEEKKCLSLSGISTMSSPASMSYSTRILMAGSTGSSPQHRSVSPFAVTEEQYGYDGGSIQCNSDSYLCPQKDKKAVCPVEKDAKKKLSARLSDMKLGNTKELIERKIKNSSKSSVIRIKKSNTDPFLEKSFRVLGEDEKYNFNPETIYISYKASKESIFEKLKHTEGINKAHTILKENGITGEDLFGISSQELMVLGVPTEEIEILLCIIERSITHRGNIPYVKRMKVTTTCFEK